MTKRLYILALALWASSSLRAQDLMPHLEEAFQKQQWNAVIQTSVEVLRRNPANAQARVRGAFALIQRGYPNAALNMLKRMSLADWKSIPADMKQLVEIVALFQKKVPIISLPARIDQLNEAEASTFLQDEIRFAKGRAAFERGDSDRAKATLEMVGKGSRYFGPACYLQGSILVKKGDLPGAAKFFALTFEPQVLQQTTEFWNDVGAKTTEQFGTSLDVNMDTDVLRKTNQIGELAIMATARVLMTQKQFDAAVAQYAKLPPSSPLFTRARLETVWAMLQLDKHEEAAKAAADLSNDDTHFESLEARPIRALILTDSEKRSRAGPKIMRFLNVYKQNKKAPLKYRQFPTAESLPAYIRGDMKDDVRISSIEAYQKMLQKEIQALQREDRMLFPTFWAMAQDLEPLISQSRQYANQLVIDQVDRRLKDLERLSVQGRLIVAETYLEERESLRAQFKNKGVNEEAQDAHDRELVKLLLEAIKEVDVARESMKTRNLSLEFRQSELLWELSSASAFLKNKRGRHHRRGGI